MVWSKSCSKEIILFLPSGAAHQEWSQQEQGREASCLLLILLLHPQLTTVHGQHCLSLGCTGGCCSFTWGRPFPPSTALCPASARPRRARNLPLVPDALSPSRWRGGEKLLTWTISCLLKRCWAAQPAPQLAAWQLSVATFVGSQGQERAGC